MKSSDLKQHRTINLSPPSLLALGFLGLILIGSLLLMLPIAHHGEISWLDAIFTATSAVTITGLSVVNVGEAYTVFGQIVIMFLLQCGGLGFMTFAILAALCRIPGGKMADKLGGVKVSIFSLVVVAITGIIMTLPLGWIPLFICAIVMAVAFGFNNAAVMKLVPVYVSQSVGGASGWIGGLGAFGGFVIPPLMGKMTELYPDKGYGLGFILFTIFSLLNIAINYLGMIRKK